MVYKPRSAFILFSYDVRRLLTHQKPNIMFEDMVGNVLTNG